MIGEVRVGRTMMSPSRLSDDRFARWWWNVEISRDRAGQAKGVGGWARSRRAAKRAGREAFREHCRPQTAAAGRWSA